jgi:hypothetical protein
LPAHSLVSTSVGHESRYRESIRANPSRVRSEPSTVSASRFPSGFECTRVFRHRGGWWVAARYPCCSQLLVDPKGSMRSRQLVRAPLKSPEQSCLLSFPLNCPKKIWVHVATKHKATVVRHRKKTLNPGPRAESSSAYCPGPLVKAAGMFIEFRGGFGHCGNGPRAGCGVARASR